MKIKILSGLALLFAVTNFLYSQDTIVQEEKVVAKPPAYDSTKTLEEQFKAENKYQFIGLKLFLPPVINPAIGPVVFSKHSSDVRRGNKHYTVIDILSVDSIGQLRNKIGINQCGDDFKDINLPKWKEQIIYAVFVLKENNQKKSINNDTLYWVVCQSKIPPYASSYFNAFISVPYFEKQKQLYQKQPVIYLSDKSKWLCNNVTFLKSKDRDTQDSTTYDIYCLMTNNKDKHMQLRPPSDQFGISFMTEKEYVWLDHASRKEKEELYKNEKDKKEKHEAECVKKFGQHNGELVAQGEIEIGMTTEMCKTAWGTPWDISKTKTASATKEIWFYNWKYNLRFEKGILVKIEH